MDSAFSHEKKFCKEKITPLGYKQSEISERENFTFQKIAFSCSFFLIATRRNPTGKDLANLLEPLGAWFYMPSLYHF